MSFFLWAGLFSLSFTWLFTLKLYTVERDAWWIVLLILGALFNSAALNGKTAFKSRDGKYTLLLLPLVITLFILPFPYNLGVILTIAGLIVLYLCRWMPFFSFISSGLIYSGAVLILQSPLGIFFTTLTSYSHSFYWLDGILSGLFSFLKLNMSYSQNSFYLLTINDLYSFPTTWDKLAFFPFLNILAGSLPLFYIFYAGKRKGRAFLKLFISGTAFLILRYAFMTGLFIYLMTFVKYHEDVCWVNIFWDIRAALLTLLPLIYILARLFPLKTMDGEKAVVFENAPFERR